MVDALSWWLLLSLFGLTALPVTLRLLRFLPSRGWALSRHIGLLLTGYLFWLLCSLGFVENIPAGILLAMMLIGGLSAVIWVRHNLELRAALRRISPPWWPARRSLPGVFCLACFAPMYRNRRDQKPMEFGFINAILRSEISHPTTPGWPVIPSAITILVMS